MFFACINFMKFHRSFLEENSRGCALKNVLKLLCRIYVAFHSKVHFSSAKCILYCCCTTIHTSSEKLKFSFHAHNGLKLKAEKFLFLVSILSPSPKKKRSLERIRQIKVFVLWRIRNCIRNKRCSMTNHCLQCVWFTYSSRKLSR